MDCHEKWIGLKFQNKLQMSGKLIVQAMGKHSFLAITVSSGIVN